MSNEAKGAVRLTGEVARQQARIIRLEKENQQLTFRCAQLEEALREAQPLVAFHMFSPDGKYNEGERVLRIINTALRSSEAPVELEE